MSILTLDYLSTKRYQGLTIVSPYLYLALVSLVIPESVWILRRQCQSQGGLLSNKNGLFVILQFTENDEIFFKRLGFESISNLLLNKFHSNLPNLS